MKKSIVLMIVLLIMCLPFSGCVTDDGGFDENLLKEIDLTADEYYSGTLNIRTWSEDTEVLIMEALIEGFNRKYPYIKVNYTQDYLDNYYPSLVNDFSVAVQTGDYSNVPDVFWIAQDRIDSFYNLGDIMFPLTKIDEIDDSFSSDIFVDEALHTCMVDGTMYILPRDFNQVVMYFNQDIFDAAGVDYPTSQMSQQEFMQMLADLRAGLNNSNAKNDYGVPYNDAVTYLIDVNALWDSWVWPLVKSFGGEVVNAQGAALDTDEVYNAVSFWKQMRDNNYVGNLVTMNVGVNFRMQQAAIFFHTRSVLTSLISSTKQIKGVKRLGVSAVPQFGPNYAVGSGASGYSMYMRSQHKTEAWLFLKYIASEEGQNIFCQTGNGIPSKKTLLYDENSAWRQFQSEKFGSAFDNDAFVYGMNLNPKPYTSTRDFFKYVPISHQQDVLTCLMSCFVAIDNDNNSLQALRNNIRNQHSLIDYYLNLSQ